MCEQIERVALPIIRPVQTIDDFVAFKTKECFPHTELDFYRHRKIFVDAARGDFESARILCEWFATDNARMRYAYNMSEDYENIRSSICPLVATRDRVALAQLLHTYEADAIKRMKLEKYWERTPFPLEEQAD